jgi:hypothetical protein
VNQDGSKWRALLEKVKNIRLPQSAGNFWNSEGTNGCSKRSLLCVAGQASSFVLHKIVPHTSVLTKSLPYYKLSLMMY